MFPFRWLVAHARSGASVCRSVRARRGVSLWLASALLAGMSLVALPSRAQTPSPKTDDRTAARTPPDKAAPETYADDDEVKLGRDNAEENDKHVKLITDAAIVERVNRIGQELAAIANQERIKPLWGLPEVKRFRYTFKVVDDKDVNAYSLPGGFIYVNKGLLDYVRSDDELAGVLAHEIIHASHHHMVKLLREQRKIQNVLLPALAAILVATRVGLEGASNLVLASQLYTVARINTYGVEAEKDADHGGMLLLMKSKYNPVGLYSFMLRMARDERARLLVDLGIYRTHPPGPERAEAAKSFLNERRIAIRLSDVDPTLRPTVTVIKDAVSGKEVAEIKARGFVLCRVVATEDQTAEERGQAIAKRLGTYLDGRLQAYEVRPNFDQTQVLVRGMPMLNQADAAAQNKTILALAREMANAILNINQRQQLDSIL